MPSGRSSGRTAERPAGHRARLWCAGARLTQAQEEVRQGRSSHQADWAKHTSSLRTGGSLARSGRVPEPHQRAAGRTSRRGGNGSGRGPADDHGSSPGQDRRGRVVPAPGPRVERGAARSSGRPARPVRPGSGRRGGGSGRRRSRHGTDGRVACSVAGTHRGRECSPPSRQRGRVRGDQTPARLSRQADVATRAARPRRHRTGDVDPRPLRQPVRCRRTDHRGWRPNCCPSWRCSWIPAG